MCRFSSVLKRTPSVRFLNIQHSKFSARNLVDVKLETINMSYTLYENIKQNVRPPLVIMHGLFGSKNNWNSLCKALQQKTQPQRIIVSVDARNHGDSPHSNNHSYEYLAEDVRTLLNQLGITKSSLLGHSMGGRAMMYFALKYPDLVDKLIVADISPISTSPTLNTMPNLFSIMEKVKLPNNIPISTARLQVDKELSKSINDKGLRAFLVTNLKQNSDGSYAWRMNLQALINNFAANIARFPEVDVKYNGPTLFLAGGNSDFIKETDHLGILKIFPKAEFKKISGAGHWLHSEKPAEFVQLVVGFLNRKD